MKKTIILLVFAASIFGFKVITDHPDEKEIRKAVDKSLSLLQQSSHTFLVNAGGCHSCHGQGLGAVTFSLAREKGFTIADSIYHETLDSISSTWNSRTHYLAQNTDPVAIVIGGGYDLWAYAATKAPSNKTLQLLTKNIVQRQREDGSWISPNARPPMEYYAFSATALSLKGLMEYLPPVLLRDLQPRIEKAKIWMTREIPVANEEKVFQLLGLTWAKGDPSFIEMQAKKLLLSQHKNGGWSQLDSLPADAYATGQSLYALYLSGQLQPVDEAYQKGLLFLLRSQYEDGSWNVQTRSFPAVPYVDSGFPHGDN
jgi:hypothetical protein